jgi:hypothetical protein
MRPPLLRFLLVLALALSASAGVRAATPPAAPPSGSVYLTTLPSGADVWLDGMYIGHSPKLIDGLTVGRHSLSVAKAGFQGRDLPVVVQDSGAPVLTSVSLDRSDAFATRGIGHLVVHGTDPLPASVAVDGSTVVLNKGACDLAAGPHTIVLITARGRMTRRVTIYADMTTDVIVRDESDGEGAR